MTTRCGIGAPPPASNVGPVGLRSNRRAAWSTIPPDERVTPDLRLYEAAPGTPAPGVRTAGPRLLAHVRGGRDLEAARRRGLPGRGARGRRGPRSGAGGASSRRLRHLGDRQGEDPGGGHPRVGQGSRLSRGAAAARRDLLLPVPVPLL